MEVIQKVRMTRIFAPTQYICAYMLEQPNERFSFPLFRFCSRKAVLNLAVWLRAYVGSNWEYVCIEERKKERMLTFADYRHGEL